MAGGERGLRVYFPRYWIKELAHYYFELDWLAFLHERGVPVSFPLKPRDGMSLGTIDAPEGKRYWAVFSWAKGKMVYPMDEDQAHAFGRGIAEVQQASDDFASGHPRFSYDLDFLFVEPIALIDDLMGEDRRSDVEFIAAVGRKAKERIEELDLSAASYGIVGGDFHGGNNHFAGNALTFFDFDICGYGWKIYDLAVFFHNAWLNGTLGDQGEHIVAGYESVRPLSPKEKEAMMPFAVGRRIWRCGVCAAESAFTGDQRFHHDYWGFTMDALRKWDEELA